MSKQEDFRDRLAGMSDEEIWLKNNIVIGKTYELDPGGHCHKCESWTAPSPTCDCTRTPIFPYREFTWDGEEAYLAFACGAPEDWVMEEIYAEAEQY